MAYGAGTSRFIQVDLAGSKFGAAFRSIQLEIDGERWPDSRKLQESIAARYGVPVDQVGPVSESPDGIEELQDDLQEQSARATWYEQEAGQAYRDLNELVEQLADIGRGIRTIDEILELARQLPDGPEPFQW